MTSEWQEASSLDVSDATRPHIPCPSCRFGNLVRLSLHKWGCSTCGYWTVSPPAVSRQRGTQGSAGSYTPLTSEQKAELKRGRDYWVTLIKVGKRAVLGFLAAFSLLSFLLNIAVRAALTQNLPLSWAIAAWIIAAFLGIVSLTLFYASSGMRKVAFLIILSFFMITGPFWFDLAKRAIVSILG